MTRRVLAANYKLLIFIAVVVAGILLEKAGLRTIGSVIVLAAFCSGFVSAVSEFAGSALRGARRRPSGRRPL